MEVSSLLGGTMPKNIRYVHNSGVYGNGTGGEAQSTEQRGPIAPFDSARPSQESPYSVGINKPAMQNVD